ncbi:hypothetical protein VNO78_02777 [Psophocarpus tetragonolobus]|uniref:AIPP2-like SPOC-like domain-containing protein n=1 Tax=Psophocarpus tetragonolobus TaxID=3891 RepID=A0AAN9XWB6_PSOTE
MVSSICGFPSHYSFCMPIITTTIPKDWLCEPCQSKHVTPSPRTVNQDIGSWASKKQRAVKTGKVKFLDLDEVIRLSSEMPSAGSKNVMSKTPKSNVPISPPNVFGKLPKNDEVHKKPKTNKHACSLLKGPKKECIGENLLPLGGVIADKNVQTHDPRENTPTNRSSFEALSTRKSSPTGGSGKTKECIGRNQLPLGGVITDKNVQTHDRWEKSSTNRPLFEVLSTRKPPILGSEPTKECIGGNQLPVGGIIADKNVRIRDHRGKNPTKREPFESLSTRKSPPTLGSGGILSVDAEWNRSNIEKSDLQSIHVYHKFLPSSIYAWRGQIQILQTIKIYDGFEAQPPCIINKKAYKFSREMPSVLQMESLPALNFLPDIFQDDSPKLQDIALYFFPSEPNERSRKNLNSILKFMNAEKSMLRSYIEGVELLVFTSNQLDRDSRSAISAVNAGDFLWGIFRQNKIDKAIERVPKMEPDDMDIDMIGGKDVVGRVDHVQKDKPKSASLIEFYNKLDVPPGFEVKPKTASVMEFYNKLDVPPDFEVKPKSASVMEFYDKLDIPPGF